MKEDGISVIIPTHDRQPLLARALASVFVQTVPVSEVIVVDDASSDGTLEWLAKHFDPRVRAIPLKDRGGAPHARNVGINQSLGRFVALLDSDDEWLPTYLQTMMGFFEQIPRPIAVCSAQKVLQAGKKSLIVRPEWKEDAFDRLLSSQSQVCIGIVADRAAMSDIRFDETLPASEERDLLIQLSTRGPIACSSEPLYITHDDGGDRVSDPANLAVALPMLFEKYRDELAARPAALANSYYRLARLHRWIGDPKGVRTYLLMASKADRTNRRLRTLGWMAQFGPIAASAGFDGFFRLARIKKWSAARVRLLTRTARSRWTQLPDRGAEELSE